MTNNRGIANIKVFGVGGGGNNAINRMIYAGVTSATFVSVNTDMQALNMSHAQVKIQLGGNLTKGLGAGSDPEVGKRAAEESIDELKAVLEGVDLLFITAGMGGGTGTGASPVIASLAKEMGILTIAVVTKPFEKFEGKNRMSNAEKGIEELKKYVDTLLVVQNEKLQQFLPKGTPFVKAFQAADDVLRQSIQGISEIIMTPSLINLDFNDIKSIIKGQGNAHIGIGKGKGEKRAYDAVRQAVQSSMLETNIGGATGILVFVSGDYGLTMDEVRESVGLIREVVDENAKIIYGMNMDESLKGEVSVTVIATGFQTLPDGSSKYSTIPKQIFTERDLEKKMSAMYGFDEDIAPIIDEEEFSEEEVLETDRISEMFKNEEKEAMPILDTTESKLPPFLRRFKKNKNVDN